MADQPTPEETYGYTFAPGDHVIVAAGADRADGYISRELRRILEGDGRAVVTEKADFDGDVTIEPESKPTEWTYVHPRHLTLVTPEPTDQPTRWRHFAPWGSTATSCGMTVPRDFTDVTDRRDKTSCLACRAKFTDQPATPQQPTPDQRAAWKRLEAGSSMGPQYAADLALVAPLFPATLTAPQPELPTEPGIYGYEGGGAALTFLLTASGQWYALSDGGEFQACASEYITQAGRPLRRLVPERPAITREQLIETTGQWGYGSDQMLALVNGTDR